MKLFVHPVYGKKIPFMCRIHLHFFHPVYNGGLEYHSYKCNNCGWETD